MTAIERHVPSKICGQMPPAWWSTTATLSTFVVQVNEPLEAQVTVKKVTGRRVMFETVCRRGSDQAVVVDGAALARMQA